MVPGPIRLGLLVALSLMVLAFAPAAMADEIYKVGWFPKGMSSYAGKIDALHDKIFVVTGLVLLITQGLLLFSIIFFRERPGHKAKYSHGNMTMEVAWTLIPVVIFIWLGLVSAGLWWELKDPKTFPKDCLEVKVVAEQFTWTFVYPGADKKLGTSDDIESPEFVVPINKPIKCIITSKDVIHSFFLPTMRLKQDAVPGMMVPVWFQATEYNLDLQVACAELCGLAHYRMKAPFKVVSNEAFEQFLKENED